MIEDNTMIENDNMIGKTNSYQKIKSFIAGTIGGSYYN